MRSVLGNNFNYFLNPYVYFQQKLRLDGGLRALLSAGYDTGASV